MSTYYDFYIGKKNKNNTIDIIGPMYENKLCSFYNRSRSFINADSIYEYMTSIDATALSEDTLKMLFYNYSPEDEKYVNTYILPMNEVEARADKGLVKGYVTLDEMRYIVENDYSLDVIDDVRILKPEIVAELKGSARNKYVMISVVNTRNFGYICNIATEVFDKYRYTDTKDDTEYYMVCVVG